MNGMKYVQKSFTLPAGNPGTSQQKWDSIFLTAEEFIKKYSLTELQYKEFIKSAV